MHLTLQPIQHGLLEAAVITRLDIDDLSSSNRATRRRNPQDKAIPADNHSRMAQA
jgi:hypothetical protein